MASRLTTAHNLFKRRRQDVAFPAEHSQETSHSTAPCYLVFLLWSDPAAMHKNGTVCAKHEYYLKLPARRRSNSTFNRTWYLMHIDVWKRVCHSISITQSKLRLLLTPKGLPAWDAELKPGGAKEKARKRKNERRKERKKQRTKKIICRTCTRAMWCR